MEYGVHSEFGRLRKILLHRPGEEMRKVTKKTLTYYRFKAVPDFEKM